MILEVMKAMEKVVEVCEICGEEFEVDPSDVVWHNKPEDETEYEREMNKTEDVEYPHYHLNSAVPSATSVKAG